MELQRADITAIFGKTGSGKTYAAKAMTARDLRLMCWDIKGEYPGKRIHTIAELGGILQAPRFRLAFQPSMDAKIMARQFDTFCKMAYAVGNVRILVDEAAMVTRPSWAPEGWRRCTLMGRARGLRILALSQRPAHIDKDLVDNATRILAGSLNRKQSCQALEDQLGDRAYELLKIPLRHFLLWEQDRPDLVTLLKP